MLITLLIIITFFLEDLFLHEKNEEQTQLIKLCTNGRVKEKQ